MRAELKGGMMVASNVGGYAGKEGERRDDKGWYIGIDCG
jgi:hypothetical protein